MLKVNFLSFFIFFSLFGCSTNTFFDEKQDEKIKDFIYHLKTPDIYHKVGFPENVQGSYIRTIAGDRFIKMKPKDQYKKESYYYFTLFHELLHWSADLNKDVLDIFSLNFITEHYKDSVGVPPANEPWFLRKLELVCDFGALYLINHFNIKEDYMVMYEGINFRKKFIHDRETMKNLISLGEKYAEWLLERYYQNKYGYIIVTK